MLEMESNYHKYMNTYREDIESELIENYVNEIVASKSNIIKERFKSIVGEDLDLEDEKNRRFKRLLCEQKGNLETIYFNDGSLQGRRIVTFICIEKPLDVNNFKYELKFELFYY